MENLVRLKEILDHGFVRLVDSMGNDLSIVRAARVSYDAEWRTGEDEGKDSKLIGYLWRNKHTSPFEAVEFQWEIKCPIFIARQWHRHRTQSYNEVSARYTELPEEFYVPSKEQVTTQSTSNKQMRTELPNKDAYEFINLLEQHCSRAFTLYQHFLAQGIPRELARSVLPLNTYTRFFAKMSLRNLFHFLELRLHPHAQYEIRVYAEAMFNMAYQIAPVACSALAVQLYGETP